MVDKKEAKKSKKNNQEPEEPEEKKKTKSPPSKEVCPKDFCNQAPILAALKESSTALATDALATALKIDCEGPARTECCKWVKNENENENENDMGGTCIRKEKTIESFGNLLTDFKFDRSCMIITIVFLILFMYKEEIMKSKFIKNLLK